MCLGSNDNDVLEIFGSGTNEGDAAYIDFLDDGTFIGSRSHRLLEGIKVYDNQVDFGNFIFGNLLPVAFYLATIEYAAKDLGVQRFHAAAQYRGIAREAFDTAAGNAERLDK